MTEVKFYILPDVGSREAFVCRLADQRYRQGQRLHIHTGSGEQARRIDQLLWTFRDNSFVPHALTTQLQPDEPHPPICIGETPPPTEPTDGQAQLLINLADEVPLFFSRYPIVVEVIDQTPMLLEAGRERYRFYRDRGYRITDHRL